MLILCTSCKFDCVVKSWLYEKNFWKLYFFAVVEKKNFSDEVLNNRSSDFQKRKYKILLIRFRISNLSIIRLIYLVCKRNTNSGSFKNFIQPLFIKNLFGEIFIKFFIIIS